MAEPLPPITPAQVVTLRALAITLTKVSLTVVAIGMVAAVDAVCRAFFGTAAGLVGWIPFAGRIVSSPIHTIERKVSNFLGGLEEHIDANMGWYFHTWATLIGMVSAGEMQGGYTRWILGRSLGHTQKRVAALPNWASIATENKRLGKQVKTLTPKVQTATKTAAHAAPHATVGKLAAVAGALERVVDWDIPSLNARTKALSDRLGKLADRIKTDAKPLVGLTAIGVVTAALTRLGLGWARCSNVKRFGRSICGMNPDALEALLAGALVVASPISIVELTKAAQKFTSEVEDGVRWFVRELP